MELPTHVLLMYGYLLLFAWVWWRAGHSLAGHAGAAGRRGALGRWSLQLLAGAGGRALLLCLIADSTWFLIGRRHGHHVLRLICKLSLEPTTCVRRTQDSFSRRRSILLMFAKFAPGLGMLTPPVAGQNGMGFGPFLLFDGIGATLWVATLLAVGRFFGDLLKRNLYLLNWAGRFSGALLILGIVGFFLGRVYRRRLVLKKLAASRLEPEELKSLIDSGEEIFIADLRHPLELLAEPFKLPGALHFSPEALAAHQHEIPRDREVVLYCTCPSEATAAKTALELHKLGIEHVPPLRGGYDEWKKLGFPMDAIAPVIPQQTAAAAR